MKTFHWTSLGVTSSMVAVLVSAAVIMPSPSGTSVAQASFQPVSLLDNASRIIKQASRHFGGSSLSDFDVASGADDDQTSAQFDALGYDLDAVLSGSVEVPRITLASLPGDLSRIRETDERKSLFFKSVLPLVLQANEQILEDRQRLWDISAAKKAGTPLDAVDRLWLAVMAERYGTRRGDVEILLRRHDVVPPSLALAQAATESAWGTSRFVKEGNAIFGEWTFVNDHDGIVPNERISGKTHRVRAFDSVSDSVMSYITNLNKHRAYQEFRDARAEMRAKGLNLDGRRLASTLHR
jgi:Bax protein